MFVEQNRQFWKVIWKAVAVQTQSLWKKKKPSWQKSNLHEMNLDELMYLSLTCKQEAQLNQVPKY